jgi:hypothetical protein
MSAMLEGGRRCGAVRAEWGLALDRETFFVPHGGDVTEHRYELLAAAVGDEFDRTYR